MKIGFSLGRCIRDIVNGSISEDEVAFIIGATCIREKEQLDHVIDDYIKLIQPRREGIHRHKQPENSVWVDMFPTELSTNESVKKAWDSYRFMLHMTENVDNESMEIFK